MLFLVGNLLSQLAGLAGRQEHVPPRRKGEPAAFARVLERFQGFVVEEVGGYRAVALVGGGEPHPRLVGCFQGATSARAGVATVEDDGDVRFFLGDFGDEVGQFLVGQVVLSRLAAVVADQRFVELVGL